MLKMETKTTHVVNYSDLETFIQEAFGLNQRFEILESPNDVSYNHEVERLPLGGDDLHDNLVQIASGHAEYWRLSGIMDVLCTLGHIEAGNYTVEVSW